MPNRRNDGNHSSKLPISLGGKTIHIPAPNRDHSSTPDCRGNIDRRQYPIQDNIHQNEFLVKRAHKSGWMKDIDITKGF
jgi:hypothetical protein